VPLVHADRVAEIHEIEPSELREITDRRGLCWDRGLLRARRDRPRCRVAMNSGRFTAGSFSQFEKTRGLWPSCAVLASACARRRAKCEGRKSYAESNPELVLAAKRLHTPVAEGAPQIAARDSERAGGDGLHEPQRRAVLGIVRQVDVGGADASSFVSRRFIASPSTLATRHQPNNPPFLQPRKGAPSTRRTCQPSIAPRRAR
jgi:hypothetical protein